MTDLSKFRLVGEDTIIVYDHKFKLEWYVAKVTPHQVNKPSPWVFINNIGSWLRAGKPETLWMHIGTFCNVIVLERFQND